MTAPRLLAALAAGLLACAGPRAGGAPAGAVTPGDRAARPIAGRLVLENDAERAALAAREALVRRHPDAWTLLGAALLDRRGLDAAAEIRHLAAAVAEAPEAPVALVALRRLSELAETSPDRARDVEAAVAPLQPRLRGLAAYRGRVARVTAAEVLGDHARSAALRLENGAIRGWALSGPYGLHAAMDFEAAFAPERGELPASLPGPLGLPARQTRPLPAPDGTVAIEGEPADGDVFYLAADLVAERGGLYIATFGTQMSVRAWLDGVPMLERRAWTGHLPTIAHVPVNLGPGAHRLVVKVAHGDRRGGLHAAFAREDGAPSDVRGAPSAPGPLPAVVARAVPAPLFSARDMVRLLEPAAGAALARLLAGHEVVSNDRESGKALLAEALTLVPGSAALHAARADALDGDPSLDEAAARARVEADLREALLRDPGNAEAMVDLASLLVRAERLDDADAVLAKLPAAAAARPAGLEARARAAEARGLSERAEALLAQAGAGATCGAIDLAYNLAGRRRAISREDELAALRATCRGGRERLAHHLRQRGDPAGAERALRPTVEARPWDLEPGLARAAALVAGGDAKGAAAAVEALLAIWPRSARLWVKLGEYRQLAGDPQGGRAARERALVLDGADLALRRALAAEDGKELLSDLAEDGDAALRAYAAGARRTDASSAMVLDAAAVELHPGGFATERTHQIIHVLDQKGVEQFGEVTVPAGADVLVLRTRKADGRKVEPERAGAAKGSVSLAGLEPGDFVETEWLKAERGTAAGYAADPFFFQVAGTRLARSVYAVAAPAGLGLAVDAHGMPAPSIERVGGRDVLRAEARDVPAFQLEPGATASTEYLPFLQAGVGAGRDALMLGLAEAMSDNARSTVELAAFAREVRAAAGGPAATPAALVRTAYARVAKAVNGQGGGLGDDASQVLSRGRGSRLVLLLGVLKELGVPARLAVVKPFGADEAPYRFPSFALYGQPVLKVEAGGETFWLEPSSRLAPFGALSAPARDVPAVLLPGPGEPVEEVRTPAGAPDAERRDLEVRIVLEANGAARLSGADTYRGMLGAGVKGALERLDARARRQAVEALLARSFRGIELEEVTFAGEDDPEAPLVIRWRGQARDAARALAQGFALDGTPFAARLGARFVQLASRRTPLLVGAEERTRLRLEIVPPPGYAATAQPEESVATPFGTYSRRDRTSDAGVLVREEDLVLARARVAPADYAAFARFTSAVDAAQERPVIVTTRGESSPSIPRS
ncbi:MAG: DUF3857 domain-containing protein [Anaeromyxobacter sp.]